MIIENINGRNVVVRHRDEDGKRITTKLSAYPYCFVREEDAAQLTDNLPSDIVGIEHGFMGLYGEALSKVSVYHPKDIRVIRNMFDHTWEANIPLLIESLQTE